MISRRAFVRCGTAAAAGMALAGGMEAWSAGMEERPLGRTGHRVRLFGLGGQATLEQPDAHDQALQIVRRAVELGVNYIDTSPRYGDGASERHIGEALAGRRHQVFLASKTHERSSRDASLRLLEGSLTRLRTDHLDLWQIHNVWTDEHVEGIFRRGGCLEALLQAREEKMVRFLGVTGHYDPLLLLQAIHRFDFDTILMPVNPADRHPLTIIDRWLPLADRNRGSFLDRLLPLAIEKSMGIIGMKVTARGRLFRPGGVTSMKQAMGYALSLPVSTVIIGCDTVEQLEENVTLAARFQNVSGDEMRRLEGLTAAHAREIAWFKRGGQK